MPDIPDAIVDAAMAAEVEYARTRRPDGRGHAMPPGDQVRRLLEAAAPLLERSIRATIAASLRRAAAGRREYAGPHDDDSEARPLLLKSAECYESAALMVEDPRSIMGVIPSWRWSAGESASIRSHPEVPRES